MLSVRTVCFHIYAKFILIPAIKACCVEGSKRHCEEYSSFLNKSISYVDLQLHMHADVNTDITGIRFHIKLVI